jgi:hypothetical protein
MERNHKTSSTLTHRYPPKHVLGWLLFIAATVALVVIILGTASAFVNQKYDGDCTGLETAGRCADKPAPTASSSQSQTQNASSNPQKEDKPVDYGYFPGK